MSKTFQQLNQPNRLAAETLHDLESKQGSSHNELAFVVENNSFYLWNELTLRWELANINISLKTIETIKDLTITLSDEAQLVYVLGYHNKFDEGGGIFVWDSVISKSSHNGGTIIDPLKQYPADWTDQLALDDWFNNTRIGEGCWVRQYEGNISMFWFGGSYEKALIKASNVANQTPIYVPNGLYQIDINTYDFSSQPFYSIGFAGIQGNDTIFVKDLYSVDNSISPITYNRGYIEATKGQSTFTVENGYRVGLLEVYLNGQKLVEGRDFIATNEQSFTLVRPANEGDDVEYVALLGLIRPTGE
jgi:hypothetical protein